MRSLHIALPDSLKQFVDGQLLEGLQSEGAVLTHEAWLSLRREARTQARETRDRQLPDLLSARFGRVSAVRLLYAAQGWWAIIGIDHR